MTMLTVMYNIMNNKGVVSMGDNVLKNWKKMYIIYIHIQKES